MVEQNVAFAQLGKNIIAAGGKTQLPGYQCAIFQRRPLEIIKIESCERFTGPCV